jgi:hypothetical protein
MNLPSRLMQSKSLKLSPKVMGTRRFRQMGKKWTQMNLEEKIEDLHQRLMSLEERIGKQVEHDQIAVRELGRRLGAIERRG